MSASDGNRAVGRWLGAARAAREDLNRRGIPTTGWVAVAVDPSYRMLRAVVEFPATLNIREAHARVWRGDPETAQSLAEATAARASGSPMLGQGLRYTAYSIDDPLCPIEIDWADYDRQMRLVRISKREDYFRRHNIAFRQRTPWATLESR